MAICNGNSLVEVIEPTQCIGNSLVIINRNFSLLDKSVCQVSSLKDSILQIDGIMASDGNGNVYTARPGEQYYLPGMAFNWPVVIYGQMTVSDNVTLGAGASLKLINGSITCGDIIGKAATFDTLKSNGTGTIGGRLDVYGDADFKKDLKSATFGTGAMTVTGKLTVTGEVESKSIRCRGPIIADGDITANYTSDERLKNNVSPISNALEKVNSLRGVEFDWNTELQSVHKGKDTGVIAQDVEKVMPTAVVDRDTGYKGVKYDRLIPLLIEAVKELTEQNVLLKAEIEALKSK